MAGGGVEPRGRVRPDVDDLVIAGDEEELPIWREPHGIGGADTSVVLDRNFGFIPGSAIELLCDRSWSGKGDQNEANAKTWEHDGPRLMKGTQGFRPVLRKTAPPGRRTVVTVFAPEGPSYVAQGGSPVS